MYANSSSNCRGFTMIELITVIVILGIISVVVLPAMNPAPIRAAQFREQVVAALRYAQKTATSHRRAVCVTFPNNASLQLTIASVNGGGCDTALPLPASNNNTLNSPDNVNAVFVPAAPAPFGFLPNGTTNDQNLTIQGQAVITVVGATGYVR